MLGFLSYNGQKRSAENEAMDIERAEAAGVCYAAGSALAEIDGAADEGGQG